MKLFIDTSSSEKIIIGIDGNKFETDAREKKAQALLPFIAEKLGNSGISIKDISEIEINPGPGSFTGLRVGVSVANTLGWSLGIPVNGKLASKSEFVELVYE
jgi:tRNA threonylcarbamoyladenosine biosynthesis protein TsaB